MPGALIYFTAAMLFIGAAPLPYGYYMLLRLVACAVFVFSAYVAFNRNRKVLPWVYGIIAVLFNPIVKIYFTKETWMVVDIASGIFLLATSRSVKSSA